ncbi:hypothetical protein GCM10007939_16350 [Amylibacter marinus]|uniref:Uncharacterized protein n=1 Tax=Amylibacter marinus TaxID=1475483 RepID=A0ABQ5VV91_9RHOB|nr:hypothetical protein [Amylibacter marinus]GLQ35352.1 hypothetical protein GCM10007939_16350 [Amylibacter marinus]
MTARPFDPQWTTDAPELLKYLDDLCTEMTLAEVRLKKRKSDAQPSFEAAIKAIVLDLYRANESNPDLEVGIASGTTTLQKLSKSRYGASFISARTFQDALSILISQGLVIITTPHWHDPSGKTSRVARHRASEMLLSALRGAGASVALLRRHSASEGIILKDGKKKKIEYGDIQVANDARDRLRVINRMLRNHWADIALPDSELIAHKAAVSGKRKEEASQSFDFAARTVHRVFNNDDWEQGGRFYGGWWISIPSELRPLILIDGKPTVEVDYSGLHAAMLYAMDGKAIPSDPYEHCYSKWSNKSARKLVKLAFNAMLNADSTIKISPIDGFREDFMGMAWQEFLLYVVSCFPEFEHHFGTGIGLRLQFRDSMLAETVMLKFASQGNACLPVHDSSIVHHALLDDLTSAMQEAFEDEFGAVGEVSYQLGAGEQISTTGQMVEVDMDELLSPIGYLERLQAFWDNQDHQQS